jgi:hypothetical protein
MTDARPVSWRHLAEGSSVWAPFSSHGWRAATVIGLGKNRAERTVCQLLFENGGQGKRQANQLYWRKLLLHGADKPPRPPAPEWPAPGSHMWEGGIRPDKVEDK